MITVDTTLTKVSEDRRSAEIYLQCDDKAFDMQQDTLRSMDAGKAAITAAVDKGVPDPRITEGPVIMPVTKEGKLIEKRNEVLAGYRAYFLVKARLI